MAILRSIDGKFYDVADSELSKYELPEEKVKELIGAASGPEGEEGMEGDVEPYGRRRWCWRNWRNCYCWRNCY